MYTMPEAIRTLSIAGGLTGSTTADLNRLNVVPDAPARNAVNLADASRMARIVAGLDY
jgi:hypothetical protein